MHRTRITSEITYIEPSTMSNFTACAGLMIGGKSKLLIDANMGPEETIQLLDETSPDIALISHYHLDHATWGALVAEHSDAELFLPAGEERYFTDFDFFMDCTAGGYGLIDEWREFSIGVTGYREISTFGIHQPGSRFSADSISVECVGAQGHSPSHTAFYIPQEKLLFTGDMGVDKFGPWYGWRDCSLPDLVASILHLRTMNVHVMLTSHGGVVTEDIQASWDRGIARIWEREERIREAMDRGVDPAVIIEDGVFFRHKKKIREPIRAFAYMWDTIMFDHHVAVLEAGGLGRLFPELKSLSGPWKA